MDDAELVALIQQSDGLEVECVPHPFPSGSENTATFQIFSYDNARSNGEVVMNGDLIELRNMYVSGCPNNEVRPYASVQSIKAR